MGMGDSPPRTETPPQTEKPPDRYLPGQRLPLDRDPPGQRPPPDRDPPGQRSPKQRPLPPTYRKERAVRIVLECILVSCQFTQYNTTQGTKYSGIKT